MTDFERLAIEYLKSIDRNIDDISFQLDALQRHFEAEQLENGTQAQND